MNTKVIPARQPIANPDGTITPEWFRFFFNLAGGSSSDIQLILDEIIDRQTDVQPLPPAEEIDDLATEVNTTSDLPFPQDQLDEALLLSHLASDGSESRIDINDSFTPYFIATGEIFTVPLFKQVLFSMLIDNQGVLDVSGYLIEVD